MHHRQLLAAFAFLALLAAPAYAATFTAALGQSTINAGTSNVLVNFTISNPSVDIAQVNFTLPSGFTYYGGGSDTNVSNTVASFSPTPMPSWYNTTTTALVAASGTGYFWFHVTTPSVGTLPGSYPFNVSTYDSAGAFALNNVSVTVQDISAPGFSANTTSPSTPVKYGPAKNYTFNATCTDNVAMAWVKFEWNGLTNYTNYGGGAVSNQSSGGYGIVLSDLLPGNYTWKWFASDTSANESTGGLGVYNVTKGDNPIVVYFNGNAATSYTISQGSTINITATGSDISLFKNGTGVVNPYIDLLPIGDYAFKANSSGNANYSANATGVTYTLRVITPPPSYSVSTTIPTTWYLNAFALFNIAWSDLNDANAFSVALIQLNYTGTATNYTMTRITSTNTSTYALNITQPMVLSWRVFANNSAGSWNATTLTESTIAKITPNLTLSVVPNWDVLRGVQTSVACASDSGGVTLAFYRNGVSVSNPDIQTLATGYYVYVCNNTATTNYSTYSVTKMLRVLSYAADISFVRADAMVTVPKNSSNTTVVVVKNVGNATQPVNITIDNITSSWYKLNATTVNVASGYTTAFLVNFTPPATADIKDYAGVFIVMTTNRTITSGFVLRILPKADDKTAISSQLSEYRANVTLLLEDISRMKTDAGLTNQTSSEQKALEAKQKIEQAEGYVAAGDYFNAQQLFSSIETLIAGAVSDLAAEKQATETQEQQVQKTEWTTWIIVAVVAIAVLVLAYLLWPGRGYSPRTSSYTFKSPAERSKEAVSELKDRIESLGSKIPGVPKKSFAPQKLQPQVPPLRYPSYEPQLYRPKPVGYSFRPKPMVPVAGRFAAQQQPLKLVKPSFLEAVTQKLSSIKDMFKPKKEEVELGEQ
jgi:hypothetical protein